ncbi:MAG: recombinase family protein, partial [Lachnospiraceae bacterium]|nr:recombinase family protein [Lachnospiraceae bacterium]
MEQLRAVTYNRCSTEDESQKDALVKQVQESENCIHERGWKLVDTYVEAKSGTTVRGRSEYNRLYRDLEMDKFDIIVIKSQDRLMRNTKDWYLFLDRMQKNRKKLYMYLEGKFYTPDDALITGIKAILAEEYSRELSKKINNAHRNRQKEGKSFVFTNRMYGLKKLPDRSIVIDEREAEMIRMIFDLSANGYGTHTSAEILYQKGYTNRNGKMLTPALIRNIIRNPVYKGTVVQNKRHYEFESKKTVNNPESEWVVHEGVVPAIVDEALFEAANRALDCRKREGHRDGQYGSCCNAGSHDLSGKIVCGLCGAPFYRTIRRN